MTEFVNLDNDFSKDFGHTDEEFPFCDALWACSTMFSNWQVLLITILNNNNTNVVNAVI